jgi:hypothetical protein
VRWANLGFCCLFLALAIAAAGASLHATDIHSRRQSDPDDRRRSDQARTERKVAAFCSMQREICRKICNLHSRFEDRFDGCPQSCESREIRCIATACFRWTDPDFLIAERFGGAQCAL